MTTSRDVCALVFAHLARVDHRLAKLYRQKTRALHLADGAPSLEDVIDFFMRPKFYGSHTNIGENGRRKCKTSHLEHLLDPNVSKTSPEVVARILSSSSDSDSSLISGSDPDHSTCTVWAGQMGSAETSLSRPAAHSSLKDYCSSSDDETLDTSTSCPGGDRRVSAAPELSSAEGDRCKRRITWREFPAAPVASLTKTPSAGLSRRGRLGTEGSSGQSAHGNSASTGRCNPFDPASIKKMKGFERIPSKARERTPSCALSSSECDESQGPEGTKMQASCKKLRSELRKCRILKKTVGAKSRSKTPKPRSESTSGQVEGRNVITERPETSGTRRVGGSRQLQQEASKDEYSDSGLDDAGSVYSSVSERAAAADDGPASDGDELVACDVCGRWWPDGLCLLHGPPIAVADAPVPAGAPAAARAVLSAPAFLRVGPSGVHTGGLGVWARRPLPAGLRFGPYRGRREPRRARAAAAGFSWEVHRRGRLWFCVDAADPARANWMRYVNCAASPADENVTAYQHRWRIFYRTCRPIGRDTELLVYYGDEYRRHLARDAGRRS